MSTQAPPSGQFGRIVKIAYFWLYIVITLGLLALVVIARAFEPIDLLQSIPTFIGAIALFGYAYSYSILTQPVWIVSVSAILLYEVVFGVIDFGYSVYLQGDALSGSDLMVLVATALFFVPYYYGIYTYAFEKRYWPGEDKATVRSFDEHASAEDKD